jgi:hypothetical protein
MRGKGVWLAIVATLALALTFWIGVGTVQAQESENYNLTLNTWAGGNYGGRVISSASYTMTISTGMLIKTQGVSTGYQLCSGFICQSDKGFAQMWMPMLEKVP